MLEWNLWRWIPAFAGMSGVWVAEAPSHPQLWSVSKPYPTSVTVSKIFFLFSVATRYLVPMSENAQRQFAAKRISLCSDFLIEGCLKSAIAARCRGGDLKADAQLFNHLDSCVVSPKIRGPIDNRCSQNPFPNQLHKITILKGHYQQLVKVKKPLYK
jgi:hypothetical protein